MNGTRNSHKRNDDDRILNETPSERGDKGRNVVYIDRFPAVAESILNDFEIVQDKVRDIIERDAAPTMRDAFELHSLLRECAESDRRQNRRIIERGNTKQWSALRRRLVSLQVSMRGAR